MRQIRSHIVNDAVSGVYHAYSRCARSLHLLIPGPRDRAAAEFPPEHHDLRKELVMAQLDRLAEASSVQVLGFSLMDSHVHLILRTDPAAAGGWPPLEVVRRWLAIHPRRNRLREAVETPEAKVAELAADADWVAATRRKLASLPQFMKDLKQHVAQQCNRLEGVGGSFWEGVYKCKPIADEEQLVATMVYVDLNPFAAGACETPEEGRYTSLAGRLERDEPAVERAADAGVGAAAEPGEGLRSAGRGAPQAADRSGPRLPRLPRRRACGAWLRPLDESLEAQRRRGQRPLADGAAVAAAARGCVVPRLSLRVYLKLVDAVSRRFHAGKQRLHAGTRGVFERIGLDADAIGGHVAMLVAKHTAWVEKHAAG